MTCINSLAITSPLWACVGPCGPLWASVGLCGPLWAFVDYTLAIAQSFAQHI